MLRVQRVGRDRPPPQDTGASGLLTKLFPWSVLLLLIVEIGLLVWIGVLPR